MIRIGRLQQLLLRGRDERVSPVAAFFFFTARNYQYG